MFFLQGRKRGITKRAASPSAAAAAAAANSSAAVAAAAAAAERGGAGGSTGTCAGGGVLGGSSSTNACVVVGDSSVGNSSVGMGSGYSSLVDGIGGGSSSSAHAAAAAAAAAGVGTCMVNGSAGSNSGGETAAGTGISSTAAAAAAGGVMGVGGTLGILKSSMQGLAASSLQGLGSTSTSSSSTLKVLGTAVLRQGPALRATVGGVSHADVVSTGVVCQQLQQLQLSSSAAAAAGGGGGGGCGISSSQPSLQAGACGGVSAAAMAAAAAAGGGGGGGSDNSQAKPSYSSDVKIKASPAASDLVLMCRRLWLMAWPLCWMEVLAFAKELIITSYVGHLGAAELSALVLAQTVYNVTGNAPMLGFVTAMETFCGQAFGAQRYKLVGLVLQRGLLISFMYCCAATWSWQFNETLLVWMGQDPTIAAAAHKFTLALGPALFMDAADQCCRRYLSSQAVVQPLMFVTCAATLLTPLYLWIFVGRFGMGLLGAAVAWDAVQATSLCFMALCCWWHTKQQQPSRCTWPGWSRDAFREWRSYIHMALPSCVMICLDWWTFEVIVMLSGLLPRPEQTMAMMGITFNIHALCFFAAHGLSGAASTRVGNDLGAGRPHMAWLTVQVAMLLGTVVMCISSGTLLLGRNYVGRLFSSEHNVITLTSEAVPPLAISLIGEGANTVLAGVMRGCGRQRIGATINLVTYWLFGLPVACLLAFPGKLGALGLWTGLACTASVQALLMSMTVFRFNWVNEAARAKALVAAGELVIEEEQPLVMQPSVAGGVGGCGGCGAGGGDLATAATAADGGCGGGSCVGVGVGATGVFHRAAGQHNKQQHYHQQQQQQQHNIHVDSSLVAVEQQQQWVPQVAGAGAGGGAGGGASNSSSHTNSRAASRAEARLQQQQQQQGAVMTTTAAVVRRSVSPLDHRLQVG